MKRVCGVALGAAIVACAASKSFADGKVWKATAGDILAACRLDQVMKAQEAFKTKNGVYAKDLGTLADHELIRKETASGIRDGFRFSMESDEATFTVRAEPAASDKGFRHYMGRPGKKIRSAFGKAAGGGDHKVLVYWALIKADKDWQEGEPDPGLKISCPKISISEGQGVYVTAVGEWKVGKNWKPHGPRGSEEKSTFGDFRMFKGDARIGCLVGRLEGEEGGYTFAKDEDCMAYTAKKAGRPQFRINDTVLGDNAGALGVFLMVLDAPDKKDD